MYNKPNHQLSAKDIKLLAIAGYLPKRLSQCDYSLCSECQFRKLQKKSWKLRSSYKKKYLKDLKAILVALAHTEITTLLTGGIIS